MPLDDLAMLHRLIAGDFMPDLTFVLDVSVAKGLKRAAGRSGSETRFERMDEAFHERLRQGFLDIARQAPAAASSSTLKPASSKCSKRCAPRCGSGWAPRSKVCSAASALSETASAASMARNASRTTSTPPRPLPSREREGPQGRSQSDRRVSPLRSDGKVRGLLESMTPAATPSPSHASGVGPSLSREGRG